MNLYVVHIGIYGFRREVWFLNKTLHRNNGPAVIYYNGVQGWFKNDEWYIDVKRTRALFK